MADVEPVSGGLHASIHEFVDSKHNVGGAASLSADVTSPSGGPEWRARRHFESLAQGEGETFIGHLQSLIDNGMGCRTVNDVHSLLVAACSENAASTSREDVPQEIGPSSRSESTRDDASDPAPVSDPTSSARLASPPVPASVMSGDASKSLPPAELFARATRASHLTRNEVLQAFAATAAGLDSEALADYLYNLAILCHESPDNELVVPPTVPVRGQTPGQAARPVVGPTVQQQGVSHGLPRPPTTVSRFGSGTASYALPVLQQPSVMLQQQTALLAPQLHQTFDGSQALSQPFNPLLRSVSDPLRVMTAMEDKESATNIQVGSRPLPGNQFGYPDQEPYYPAVPDFATAIGLPAGNSHDLMDVSGLATSGLLKTTSAPEHELQRLASPDPLISGSLGRQDPRLASLLSGVHLS